MKYIFIDTNQYRHIYSSSEGFSQEVYDLLVRLIDQQHVQLLLPQQTKDEVERNRFRAWPEAEEKDVAGKIEKAQKQIEEVTSKFGNYAGAKTLLKNLKSELKKLEREKSSVTKRFVSLRSAQNQKIKKLFSKAQTLPESPDIIERAKYRQGKNNPPYSKDSKLGDPLIWECLISYLKERRTERPRIIFVSNDKNAWGRTSFDPWLDGEYKKTTNGQIIFSNRLSDIPDLTTEEQERIRKEEEENLKKNAISDFVSSSSFVNAGGNAQKLLRVKNLLTDADYRRIIEGSVSNHEIYQSFFTGIPLKTLLEGENGYVVKQVESAPKDIWDQFEKRFQTGLKRQSDESTSEPFEDINPDGIPF